MSFRKEKFKDVFNEFSSNLKSLIRNQRRRPRPLDPEIHGTIEHWLEDSIAKKQIKYYEYSEFKRTKVEDGSVVPANWKNHTFSLKSFKNDKETQLEVIDELKLHMEIKRHENILHFYGVTKLENVQMNEYILVLEYADSGSLNAYLKEHFKELSWNDKFDLASQLASAVSYLHDNNMIHRNLHDSNILIHKKSVKLANFGSKVSKSDNTKEVFSILPYTDPKSFYAQDYELNEKSDVYSVGVLLWQISSGYQPFRGEAYNTKLTLDIMHERREKIIDGTPDKYSNLYTACWSYEPDERPDICEVVSTLNQLKSIPSIEFPDDGQADNQNEAIKWIEDALKNEKVKSIPFNELTNPEPLDEGGFGSIVKAIYTKTDSYVVYKKLIDKLPAFKHRKLDAFIHELQMHLLLTCNDRIVRCLGISKVDTKEYLLVMQYANGGNLRDYLKSNFSSLTWDDKKKLASQIAEGLKYLHNENVLHKDLHAKNIVIHENNAKITDFNISKFQDQASPFYAKNCGIVPYMEPNRFLTPKFPYNKYSDIYSFGVLMWEISSGYPPFKDIDSNDIVLLALAIAKGEREGPIHDTPKEYEVLYKECWDQDPEKRPTIHNVLGKLAKMDFGFNTNIGLTEENDPDNLKKPVTILSSKQQIIQQFKLNHGLFLDGCNIEPSKQAIFFEDGELNINLYKGQPLIYTSINDRSLHENLLSLYSNDNNNELNKALKPSDICINFPIAEITYNADLLESFSKFMNISSLYEMYGHLFARKILIGGKLFINDFKSATSTQTDFFKSLLTWIYESAKYNKENPFNNLTTVKFFPKITTLDGKKLNTPEELTNWMNNLYRKSMADIISYNNLIPVSKLRSGSSSSVNTFHEKQPGVANFKEKLILEEWIKDSIYVNLTRWVREFRLLQGLRINNHFELEISKKIKKIAVNFMNVPNIDSSDKFYLEMIKPATTLEEFLNDKDKSFFPFIKNSIKPDDSIYGDYTHFLTRREQYKITLSRFDIKPSEEFKQAIENAIDNMKPFICLQNVFDEYGYFFPLNIVLGKSLKHILPNSSISNTFKKIDLGSLETPLESLKSHLDDLKISYLLTQKGNIIKKNELSEWIQNTSNDLEITEFDNIITLYNILEGEQRRKIDNILKRQDGFNIIMTGIVELKDLDINNMEHYKRINIKPSLEDKNYRVFGSIISKNNLKLEDFLVKFGSYDFNGFSAMIKTLKNTNINITECYILWMIIGNPSELSVFSPKNRELQVDYFKKSITLHNSYHLVNIPSRKLSLGDIVSVNIYCSATNYEPINIKLAGWSKNYINFQILKPIYNNPNLNVSDSNMIISDSDDDDDDSYVGTAIVMDLNICILSSDYKSLKIDNEEKECYSDLIGYKLTEENFQFLSDDQEDNHLSDDQADNEKKAIKWIENALKNEKVKDIPFNELTNPEPLNEGGFGSIVKAIYTKTDSYVVYKKLTNTDAFKHCKLDAFIHELQMHLLLTCSDRIVRCLGISKVDTKEYLLVMQYADGGNLQDYLKSNFSSLTWNDKKKLASQIAEGLNYLHNEGVLHKDLHSRNIVVHENNARITNFNISKIQDQISPPFYEKNCGIVSYMEPNRFLDPKFPYDKYSDIYSFGVLMWEISSGYPPFKDIDSNDNATLALSISNGLREDTIPETPKEYEELYKICWDQEPEQRPIIRDVLSELTKMDFGFNTNIRLTEEPTEVGNLNLDLNSDLLIRLTTTRTENSQFWQS